MEDKIEIPMVDIISEVTGKTVVMIDTDYVYLDTNEVVDRKTLTKCVVIKEEKETKIIESKQIAEAKQYLQDTDYKVLPDYDGNKEGILEARAEARALIRGLEG